MKGTLRSLTWFLAFVVLSGFLSSGMTAISISASQPGDEARFYELVRLAVGGGGRSGDLNDFWRRTLEQYDPTISYVPPAGVEAYEGEVFSTGPCPRQRDNAFYCFDNHTVAWDELWLIELFNEVGDVAPLAILAHEWGHHIQNLLQTSGKPRGTTQQADIQAELQADCFAGLYLVDAERRDLLGEDHDAILWGGLTFFREGNEEFAESNWFAEDEHGPPASRALAFTSGFLGSTIAEDPELAYCLNYTSYVPVPPLRAGDYAINLPPGTEVEHVPEAGLIGLQHSVAGTIIVPESTLPARPAREQFDSVLDRYFTGFTVRKIGTLSDVFMGSLGGTAVAQTYERSWTEAGNTVGVHGILALHVSPMGGGLILDVFAPGSAPVTSDGWNALLAHLFILAYGTCAPGAPESVACMFSELAYLNLQELFIRASYSGIVLSSGDARPIEAGRTLVTFVNHDIEPERLVGFHLVKIEGALDETQLVPPAPPVAQPPDWFYDATLIGSPLVLPGGRAQMVVDLTPGEWVVVGAPDFRPVSQPFTVLEPANPSVDAVEEPPTALTVVERDNAFAGLEMPVEPGHQIWKVTNSGSQPHQLTLFRFPHAVTTEEALQVIERIRTNDNSSVPGLDFAPKEAEHVGSVGSLSPGQTVWVEFANLVPGHYAAICFVKQPGTGRRHETMGELQLFDVTSSPLSEEIPVD